MSFNETKSTHKPLKPMWATLKPWALRAAVLRSTPSVHWGAQTHICVNGIIDVKALNYTGWHFKHGPSVNMAWYRTMLESKQCSMSTSSTRIQNMDFKIVFKGHDDCLSSSYLFCSHPLSLRVIVHQLQLQVKRSIQMNDGCKHFPKVLCR